MKNEDKIKPRNSTVQTGKADHNIWQEILQQSMSTKDLEEGHVFIFGGKNVGKRNLVKTISKQLLNSQEFDDKHALKIEEEGAKYALIDYNYLQVKKLNELDSENLGKLNVWIINEFLEKELLETIIKPEYITKSIIIIALDLSQTSGIMESLKAWTNYVYEAISSLLLKLPFDEQERMRAKVANQIKIYEEPQFDEEGNFRKNYMTEENLELKQEMALPEGVLKINMGVPLAIVINKTDVLITNDRRKYEEDSDFILKHIRNFALTYGASILYTSTKQNVNLNVLYDYILHQIYDFDFIHKCNLIDKDAFFIPSGYDSLSVLRNYDMNNELSQIYDERIPVIKSQKALKEEEVICEDFQSILNRLKSKQASKNMSMDLGNSVEKLSQKSLLKKLAGNIKETPKDDSSRTEKSTPTSKMNNNKPNFEIFNNTSNSNYNSNNPSETKPSHTKGQSQSKEQVKEEIKKKFLGSSTSKGSAFNETMKKFDILKKGMAKNTDKK